MTSPTLRVSKGSGHFSNRQRHAVHCLEVGIQPLTEVKPFLLAAMTGQGVSFGFMHRRCVYKNLGNDPRPQTIAQAVWHGVINRDLVFDRASRRGGLKIRHAAGERGRSSESAGV